MGSGFRFHCTDIGRLEVVFGFWVGVEVEVRGLGLKLVVDHFLRGLRLIKKKKKNLGGRGKPSWGRAEAPACGPASGMRVWGLGR